MTASTSDDGKDKLLFTPGPLTTSYTVKQAMLRDFGSRTREFVEVVRDVRSRLLRLAGVPSSTFDAVIMQGSGTFALEAVVSSTVPPGRGLLVLVNGAYGRRIAEIARVLGIPCRRLEYPEHRCPDPADVARVLEEAPEVSHVAVVHCETTTGIINPVEAIGRVVSDQNRVFLVDAMSSFGGIPIDLEACGIDYLVTSANKCLEGVPGFGIVLARRAVLEATEGYARSLSLDLLAQARRLQEDGQFRFTPPTHALVAFRQALIELDCEGGIAARSARYQNNHRLLLQGMASMGFEPYLSGENRGYIITSFRYPAHPAFRFETFHDLLEQRGHVIYPGKLGHAPCFRIGHIGHVFSHDVVSLLGAIEEVLLEMGIAVPVGPRGGAHARGTGAVAR